LLQKTVKVMFNLNESNRIVMAQHPTDMRKGVNTLCCQVRMLGLDPSNGDVYIFVGRSRRVMKLLHWERGGYVIYYKRMEVGRVSRKVFRQSPSPQFYVLRWDELVLFLEGIFPSAGRRKRFNNQ
jgi:hypothetical protein